MEDIKLADRHCQISFLLMYSLGLGIKRVAIHVLTVYAVFFATGHFNLLGLIILASFFSAAMFSPIRAIA